LTKLKQELILPTALIGGSGRLPSAGGLVFLFRRSVATVAAAVLVFGLAACGNGSGQDGRVDRKRIAFLLPDVQATRYDRFDVPYFADKVESLCPECGIIYRNAAQLAKTQQFQAEEALENGADVLVLDPVDAKAARSIVKAARDKKVPVISYDRLVENADLDYYVSFDNQKVGELQATALVEKLRQSGRSSGRIVMINGSDTDNNAKLFNKGAHSVLDGSGFDVVPKPDYFTPDWEPAKAQQFMTDQINQLRASGAGDDSADSVPFVGVYAANDGTAGGAIEAMLGANVKPLPPVTGQDAELPAIQRILADEQYMTVYKAYRPQAEKAAELAVALVKDQQPKAPERVNNGFEEVPSVLLEPTVITKANLRAEVLDAGLYTAEELCTGKYAGVCSAAGIG
jgi:D-xylose transport system substrate-binding protein